jgi:hypothetical protein
MRFTLTAAGDNACTLKEVTPSSTASFPIPVGKPALVDLIRTFLADPEARDLGQGPIRLDRMRDGIRINVGAGAFTIPYAFVYPLILAPAA